MAGKEGNFRSSPAVLGLQGLSPATFVVGESFETVDDNGILEDSTITFYQMLEWAQPLDGFKDHSNTPAEMTNAYDADYKKRCVIRGANFNRSK